MYDADIPAHLLIALALTSACLSLPRGLGLAR